MSIYFIICTHCVIFLLHEGRLGADQYDQNMGPTSIVGKNKEKIWTQIVESMRIRSYALKILPIASIKPPESLLASMTMEINYHRRNLQRRCAPHVNTCKRGLRLQTSTEKRSYICFNLFFICAFCL